MIKHDITKKKKKEEKPTPMHKSCKINISCKMTQNKLTCDCSRSFSCFNKEISVSAC